jgi:diadenosine tetraphosphatase ApaH/serine/threonine PP2A family protein phosphatase
MYAVLSDVHSNVEALEAVLEDIGRRGIREILFLGDAVGYGPDPDVCVALLQEQCGLLLAGNHDWGACGLTDISNFNENARAAILWTRGVLRAEHLAMLGALPVRVELREKNVTLVHSTPWETEKWHYLLYLGDADLNFRHFDTGVCFIGHSHSPVIIEQNASGRITSKKEEASLSTGSRFIINVGSVGQPRDGDPRACYALVVDGRVEFVRVPYRVERTQEKMARAGLPLFLRERLAAGR